MQTPITPTFSTKRYSLGESFSILYLASIQLGKGRLAESTCVLDELTKAYPRRLGLFRTRGIVRTFRDDYFAAVEDFTHALKEARALRKARSFHHNGSHAPKNSKGKRDERKRDGKKKSNGQALPNGTSNAEAYTSETETPRIHPPLLPGAPQSIKSQLLFLRAVAYLQKCHFLGRGEDLG
jgi:hypothetical protein